MAFIFCDFRGEPLRTLTVTSTDGIRDLGTRLEFQCRVPKSKEGGRYYGSQLKSWMVGGTTDPFERVQLLDTAMDKARKLSVRFPGLVVLVRGNREHAGELPRGVAEAGTWQYVQACRDCPKFKDDAKECRCEGRGWVLA